MIAKIFEFIGTLGTRAKDSKHTTIGGGVAGVAFAIFIKQLEDASGCHFAEAFAGVNWVQIAGFTFMQTFGLVSTDAKKTV